MAKKVINLNALTAVTLLAEYAEQVQKVAEAIASAQAAGSEASEAGKERRETVADSLKVFAAETLEAGIKAADAGAVMREGLAKCGFPQGTCDNYGRAVQGFRVILETEGPGTLDEATVKQAQMVMRSAAQVAIDDARSELAPFIKAATADQLKALKEHAESVLLIVPKKRKSKDDESSSQSQQDEPAQSRAA